MRSFSIELSYEGIEAVLLLQTVEAWRAELDINTVRVDIACEFSARRKSPSGLYAKNPPAALRIFETSRKATFAILSAQSGGTALRSYKGIGVRR
jgi:hypothetical protein